MLKYRVLLVDTEGDYRRPVQAFYGDVQQATDWACAVLRHATGKDAYVQIYLVNETEVGTIKKSDLDDQGAISGLQPATEETSKP